jgi:hypothetical protein
MKWMILILLVVLVVLVLVKWARSAKVVCPYWCPETSRYECISNADCPWGGSFENCQLYLDIKGGKC